MNFNAHPSVSRYASNAERRERLHPDPGASSMDNTAIVPNPWPPTQQPIGQDALVLDADCAADDDPALDLSAAARFGDTLFLGSDEGKEGLFVERLLRIGDRWAGHRRFPLGAILDLESADEADIEGLAAEDGWLWVLGSHARTRPRLTKRGDDRIELAAFAKLKGNRARCLLARIPIAPDPDVPGAFLPVRQDGERRAGMLKPTRHGNALARMMAEHVLLRPFTRIAAKEGGVDLEGIAVAGTRLALGMRGPVVQTYAMLLEIEVAVERSGRIMLAGPLHKRLLKLDGLGIRDLARAGGDLLILAGPTTSLDGPCAVYRWHDWLHDPAQDDQIVRLHRPERIIDLPFGRGDDHPEGLVLIDRANGAQDLIVICDSPGAARLDAVTRTLACDRFALASAGEAGGPGI